MARRIALEADVAVGLRDRLIAATEADLDHLEAADTEVYNFGVERLRLERRIEDLNAGRDVEFRRWGDCVGADVWPDRKVRLCVLVGDELRPG